MSHAPSRELLRRELPRTEPAEKEPDVGSDLKFLIVVGVALIVISSLPYLYGYLFSPPGKQFMGLDYTVYDYAQYVSWARESESAILVPNKLTPELNSPAFFNLLWWLVGRTDRYFHLTFFQTNQLLRLLSTGLFLWVTYQFCSLSFADRQRRRFAFVLACLASGFGWALVGLKQFTGTLLNPTVVYNSPGNTFFGVMEVPHQIISAALLVGIFLLTVRSYRRDRASLLALAGLLGLILGLEHTYDLVTAYAVVGAFTVLATLRDGIRARWLGGVASFYLISVPAALFWIHLTLSSAVWREVLAQYRNLGVFTPDPVQLVLLLGPTFILAILTFRGFVPLVGLRVDELFLNVWFLVVLFLIYLPVNFQIMMLNGFQVALAILATRGLFDHVLPWLQDRLVTARWPVVTRQRLGFLVPALFLALVLPTTLYLLSWRVLVLSRHEYPNYLDRGDVAALNWLDGNAGQSEVVLSSMPIGIYVPGLTGAHAVIAHGADTLDFARKRAMVAQFYNSDTSDSARRQILRELRVRYVFDGPAERQLGTFDPREASYLQLVFSAANTQVYRVRDADLAVTGGEGRIR
ncbi:MAG TPA: hypothetical protein VFZ25_02240 [Chloroflexota bacterium]|nr:hypothetical protein [Chloroflexota bacterium]